jgi:hypothetical protein
VTDRRCEAITTIVAIIMKKTPQMIQAFLTPCGPVKIDGRIMNLPIAVMRIRTGTRPAASF